MSFALLQVSCSTIFMLQLAIWWFIHVAVLFWRVYFPFHAQTYAHRLVHIHVITVTIAIVGPLVPVIAALAGEGFALPRFPPILCVAKEADPTFYALVLPIIVLLQIGVTLLILVFRVIHKVLPKCI